MLKNSCFNHGWPKPVEIIFQVLMSPKALDENESDETLFSDASPESVSSMLCATGPVSQEWTYPSDELRVPVQSACSSFI